MAKRTIQSRSNRSERPIVGYANISKVDTSFEQSRGENIAYVEAMVTGGVLPNHEYLRPQVEVAVEIRNGETRYFLDPKCPSVGQSIRARNRHRVSAGIDELPLESNDYPAVQETLEAIGLTPQDLGKLQGIVWNAKRKLGL